MGEELKQLSLLNLRDLAKAKSIKNISKMNKDELIDAILSAQESEEVKEEIISDVKIEDPTISKKHFSIISENGGLFIRDEGSTNGTYVDGVKIAPKTQTRISASSSIRAGDLEGKIYKV